MATHTDPQLVLINQLIAEKDRLVAEKDELVVSKDKLWREMYSMVRERDARIEQLEHGARMLRPSLELDEQPDLSVMDTLRQKNAKLTERNRALEEALRDLLDREEEVEDDDEAGREGREDEMVPHMAVKDEEQEEIRVASMSRPPAKAERGIQFSSSPARPNVFLPSPLSKSQSAEPATLPAFSFAPLITMSDVGMYDTGDIGAVAPVVVQSIRSQLANLETRVKEGRSPAAPSPQFQSTGCLWAWMMSSANDTRWTTLSPREFACGSCFNSRRACLLWLGQMRYIILPLPPAVRKAEATWEDAAYYIQQGAKVNFNHFPGVWEASKKKGGGR